MAPTQHSTRVPYSFRERLAALARSPQGKRLLTEARNLSRDPDRRRQIDELRKRLLGFARTPAKRR